MHIFYYSQKMQLHCRFTAENPDVVKLGSGQAGAQLWMSHAVGCQQRSDDF